ncbi:MAG: hypothetical protein V4580_07010 [Bacteroidota bacterium]|jgi:hypothetical protein
MKKQLFFAFCVSGLFLASCKKQHSCQCVTTFSKTGYSSYTVSSTENIDKKVTKKTGEQMCLQAEKQMTKNHQDYISGPSEKITVSCSLK